MRTLRTMLLAAAVTVVATAAPASASTPVVAEAKPWHFWLAPILFGSAVLIVLALMVGYVVKVTIPKYRGR